MDGSTDNAQRERTRVTGAFRFRVCDGCGDAGRLRVHCDNDGVEWHVKRGDVTENVELCGQITYRRVRQAPSDAGQRSWTPPSGFYDKQDH
jgi:hypothetical protein